MSTPVVNLVLPSAAARDLARDDQHRELRRLAEARGWKVLVRRVADVRVQGQGVAKVIEPWDAAELYRSLHRNPSAVLQLTRASIRLDPTSGEGRRNLISLMRFVRYKSYWSDVDLGAPLGRVIDSCAEWFTGSWCSGDRDPRCLPLHMFAPKRDWGSLDAVDGVRDFDDVHGPPMGRVDELGRQWQHTKVLHGRESLVVGGMVLSTGMHWDVLSERSSGRIANSAEVWKFARGAYCNVYPDAHIRRGQVSGRSAQRVRVVSRPLEASPNGERSRAKRRRRG